MIGVWFWMIWGTQRVINVEILRGTVLHSIQGSYVECLLKVQKIDCVIIPTLDPTLDSYVGSFFGSLAMFFDLSNI